VRERWVRLLGCSVLAILGIVWLSDQPGLPTSAWASIECIGIALCALVSAWALATEHRTKWPAAVALVCAAPMTQNFLLDVSSTRQLVSGLGLPYLVLLLATLAVVVFAVAILVLPLPPPADASVSRARIVR
jgi:hypothetical protein